MLRLLPTHSGRQVSLYKQIHLCELVPVINEVLNSGGEFTFFPSGNSMRPMLYGKNCSVTITKPCGRLKKYDLPLYQNQQGNFILHRVVKVLPDSYIMRGDCVVSKEYGITDSQLIGVVTSFTRFGKKYSVKHPVYRAYCILWVAFPLLRRFVMHFGKRQQDMEAL